MNENETNLVFLVVFFRQNNLNGIRNFLKIVNIQNVEFVKTCGDQLTNSTTILLIKIYVAVNYWCGNCSYLSGAVICKMLQF